MTSPDADPGPDPGPVPGGPAAPGADPAAPAPPLPAPAAPEQSREDTDAAWGEFPARDDDRLDRDRPPHWEDF